MADAALAGKLRLSGVKGSLAGASLERLREATAELDAATSGLVVLLELCRRAESLHDPGWVEFSAKRSTWQPSVADVLAGRANQRETGPTVAETLRRPVFGFIIVVTQANLQDHPLGSGPAVVVTVR